MLDLVQNHVVTDQVKTYEEIYINLSAFFATNTKQITMKIDGANLNEFKEFINDLKEATQFQHSTLDGKLRLKPIIFTKDTELLLKSYLSVKANSNKTYMNFYINDEDKTCLAYFTAIKGDQYEI